MLSDYIHSWSADFGPGHAEVTAKRHVKPNDDFSAFRLLASTNCRGVNQSKRGGVESLGHNGARVFEAAEHENDAELYTLLDDMNYLLNETLMGAQAKGETVLPSISAKLKQLDEREKLRIRNEQPETGL